MKDRPQKASIRASCLLPYRASSEMVGMQHPCSVRAKLSEMCEPETKGRGQFLVFLLGNCAHHQKGISDKVSPGVSLEVMEV